MKKVRFMKTITYTGDNWFANGPFPIGKAELEISSEVGIKTNLILDEIEMHEILCSRKKIHDKSKIKY